MIAYLLLFVLSFPSRRGVGCFVHIAATTIPNPEEPKAHDATAVGTRYAASCRMLAPRVGWVRLSVDQADL